MQQALNHIHRLYAIIIWLVVQTGLQEYDLTCGYACRLIIGEKSTS